MDHYQSQLIEKLHQRYAGKKIVILGFGREGKSSYRFLRRLLPEQEISIMDENPVSPEDTVFEGNTSAVCVQPWDLSGLNEYDLIFKTPGIPGFRLQGIDGEKITSQTNEFIALVGKKVIGITGTKGKSTTSSLVCATLRALGYDAFLVGNIGRPALELLAEDTVDRLYVYEMSSHQTQFLKKSPRIAVVLNLFEEHLDNYRDYEEYKEAKLCIGSEIFESGQVGRWIYGIDNAELMSYADRWQGKGLAFGHWHRRHHQEAGIFLAEEGVVFAEGETRQILCRSDFPRKLLGEHNLCNALVAFAIVKELEGLSPENIAAIVRVIAEFPGLEHRLEYVTNRDGIAFYNDSISTIPAAALEAIRAIPNIQTLIIGGFDRGIHYDEFVQELNKRSDLHLICLPATGHRIFPNLAHPSKYLVLSMQEAVDKAYEITERGFAAVLSPAAASYTFYRDFEERGNDFKARVLVGARHEARE